MSRRRVPCDMCGETGVGTTPWSIGARGRLTSVHLCPACGDPLLRIVTRAITGAGDRNPQRVVTMEHVAAVAARERNLWR